MGEGCHWLGWWAGTPENHAACPCCFKGAIEPALLECPLDLDDRSFEGTHALPAGGGAGGCPLPLPGCLALGTADSIAFALTPADEAGPRGCHLALAAAPCLAARLHEEPLCTISPNFSLISVRYTSQRIGCKRLKHSVKPVRGTRSRPISCTPPNKHPRSMKAHLLIVGLLLVAWPAAQGRSLKQGERRRHPRVPPQMLRACRQLAGL